MDNLIEHLIDPQDTIKKVSRWLSNDGYICVSVPNRWNFKNLLKLDLNREFNYPSEHLNIYTKRSINFVCNFSKFIAHWVIRNSSKINDRIRYKTQFANVYFS